MSRTKGFSKQDDALLQQQQKQQQGGGTSGTSTGSSNNEKPSQQQQPWGLTKTMFVVILVCTVLSGMVNIYHAHHSTLDLLGNGITSSRLKVPTAVHESMQDFLRLGIPVENRKKSEEQMQEEEGVSAGAGDDLDDEIAEHLEQQAQKDGKADIAAETYDSPIAGLNCEPYGGPSNYDAQEMVYWQDIPDDAHYVSPFHIRKGQHRRYMTFEPDGGGWNNIRMAMETVLGLAIAMGRTLVLPPEQRMYLLGKNRGQQKTDFGFNDFFPLQQLAQEHEALEIITMTEFLETEAMAGNLIDKNTGKVTFPPGNVTNWDGLDVKPLKEWLRNASHTPLWAPGQCLAAFPASRRHADVDQLYTMVDEIHKQGQHRLPRFLDEPTPVDASPMERLRENLAGRKDLCVYDETMQQELVVHFMCYHKMHVRLLVHFYCFLYFEDWREDLWMKRFMRDHVRYIDEVQCAAARIVHAMREYARKKDPVNNPQGDFDTFHVRRGDFQFKATRIEAEDIYDNVKDILKEGSVVYIATDERNKKFFKPLQAHYDVKFMDDFIQTELTDINTNYFGMIDQLVASRGRLFFGCYHSTFTGFIMRMRGYHSVKDKTLNYEHGLLPTSYYYVPTQQKFAMHQYAPVNVPYFNREFPTSWRDIDKGIGNLPNPMQGG